MKKKILWVVIPLLLIAAISVLLFFQIKYPKKTFSELLGTDEANITKVLMRKGFDMSSVETTDKAKIKELINMLNDRYYKKSFNQDPRTGYIYGYIFYSGNNKALTMVCSGNNIYIDNKEKTGAVYYNAVKEISIDWSDNWFNSLSDKK
ncbi:hypothetical protein CLHUN_09320 [Ruminiclostridium hungatei]|uniref:Uncharacterized protein n=1 Tax=Ruminiclostridium hungatei TaxID=48256 RepID=A0A1V4SP29_RUMHU|nr:hypothetical protein [Ruminiclostridium hungatei]OPX45553.1 hypothetical protein CLHUN_09320 [Ruminiclostridium hungatei]